MGDTAARLERVLAGRWGPAVAAAVTSAIVLACAWPVVLDPAHRVVGDSNNDFASIAWGLDHVARALLEGRSPLGHTDRLSYPNGRTLVVSDLPEVLLLAPIVAVAGPVVVFNLLSVLHHALAAAAAWWCAGRFGASTAGRATAAVAFAFAPALVGSTYNQNPDVTAWYWVPLAIGLAAGPVGWRSAALAGAVAGLAAWCNPYGGVMAALALPFVLVQRRWLPAFLALVVVGGAAALVYHQGASAPDSATFKAVRDNPLHGVSTLWALVWPVPTMYVEEAWDEARFVHGSYLGWSLLIAGLAGLIVERRWRWLALVLAALLLSMGPSIHARQLVLVQSPLRWLDEAPLTSRLQLNHRYTALAVLVLGLGAARLARGRWRWLLPALVAWDLLGLAGGARLLAAGSPWEDGSCALLRQLDPGPVVDLPGSRGEFWLYSATCHGNPVAESLNQPLPSFVIDGLDAVPAEEGLGVLRRSGYRWAVFHQQSPRIEGPSRFALMGPALADPEHCIPRRNDRGVTVIDLWKCPAALPRLR